MKRLVFGLVAIIVLIAAAVFIYSSRLHLPLLSPYLPGPQVPDVTPKLTATLIRLPELDYTGSTTVPTLADRISYLVYNPSTAKVYAAKNSRVAVSPASFTKVLTAQVALDLASPEDMINTTPAAIDKVPTVLGLKLNESLSVSDLLRASIATSANDAATLLGEGVAQKYDQPLDFFIAAMNTKAQYLGMSHSHFATADGLDAPDQFSTLEDIARLVHNSKNYPLLISAAASDRRDIEASTTHGRYYLPNWNGLLGVYPGVDGLKIAYTETAGYSTIVTVARNDIPVVVILTGADSIRERDMAAAALLDHAYLSHRLPPVNVTRTQLNRRYQAWTDLANQIKEELKALESTPQ